MVFIIYEVGFLSIWKQLIMFLNLLHMQNIFWTMHKSNAIELKVLFNYSTFPQMISNIL
jgi:hypothetical protein